MRPKNASYAHPKKCHFFTFYDLRDPVLRATMQKIGNDVLVWDKNGQLKNNLVATQLVYNWDGKLRSATAGSDSISLKYDPRGNRVYKSSTVKQGLCLGYCVPPSHWFAKDFKSCLSITPSFGSDISHNHTGYAQVLEETTAGVRTTYTIGDTDRSDHES